ncbi:MAG: hypothetical protein K0R75_1768 [Paenibacillaceae bacterium]|nr:hypothetical protein [Paenibacillaceae bacterium]
MGSFNLLIHFDYYKYQTSFIHTPRYFNKTHLLSNPSLPYLDNS